METYSNILTLKYLGETTVFAPLSLAGINTYTLEYNYFGPFVAYSPEASTFTPIVCWVY